jgi:hypothetical protein
MKTVAMPKPAAAVTLAASPALVSRRGRSSGPISGRPGPASGRLVTPSEALEMGACSGVVIPVGVADADIDALHTGHIADRPSSSVNIASHFGQRTAMAGSIRKMT